VKTLLLTSETASNKSFLFELLSQFSEVVTFSGQIDIDFIRKYKVSHILSDRNSHIISRDVISEVEGRAFNTHPSLLPLHRGWQPIFFSILEKTDVGVSVHQIDPGLDTGPLLGQMKVDIFIEDTLASVHAKCRIAIMSILAQSWQSVLNDSANLEVQKGIDCFHTKKEFDKVFKLFPKGWKTEISEM
jgi:methionyl-tRNA formyltransferase